MAGPGFTWVEQNARGVSSQDDLDFSSRWGGGVDFYVTDNLALQAQASYLWTIGRVGDFDYTSLVLGLQYMF